tara:strand:- start:1676 stop:3655 length:1980 start_codon:yes stop_codon:yes gene_type:complete
MGIKEEARKYDALGFELVAMKSGHKGPNTPNWGDKGVDVEQLTDDHNIGLLHNRTGTMSVDIDDRQLSAKVFEEVLGIDPEKMKKEGICWRGSHKGIKFLYRMPHDAQNLSIKKLAFKEDNNIITVFELRGSTGNAACHDLLPPSIHPSGIPYEWINPPPNSFEDIPVLPEVLMDLWENWEAYEKLMLMALGKWKPEPIKHKLPTKNDTADIIDMFNRTHSAEEILEKNGYIKKGKNRYLSPHSSTKTPGIVVLEDGTIYSHHGADVLGDGHSHDAFDLARILEANSDWKSAFNLARKSLGIEEVTYKPQIDQRALRFYHAKEAIDNIETPRWIIRNVAEEDSIIGMFGSPKAGKSFVAIDMACCVATGKDWHEKTTKEGLVLYLCAEGHRNLAKRLLSWSVLNKTSLDDSKFHYSDRGVSIQDPLDAELMRNEALVLQDLYKEPPKLVIIDTVARNFVGNENSTEDMNSFIYSVDRWLREEFRCGVLLVHHTGHNEKGRGRGSSVLPAALDAELRVKKNDGLDHADWSLDLEQTLVKDGRGISPMRFQFQECEFMELKDEDGYPTTSGGLISIPYEAKPEKKALGKNQEFLLNALESIYYEKLSKDGMKEEVFVTQEELTKACDFDIYYAKKALKDLGYIEEVGSKKFTPTNIKDDSK